MSQEVLKSRQLALNILSHVLHQKQNLDDVFDKETTALKDNREKAFIRMLVTTALRRLGQIDFILKQLLEKPLPAKANAVYDILRLAVCQILFMQVPQHAAVSTAVDLAKTPRLSFYTKLINGTLRNLCRNIEKFQNVSEELNTPEWLLNSWIKAYGKTVAHKIALANLTQPATFVSVKENPSFWAEKLNGKVNETDSVELPENAYIPDLDGFSDGAWWVQDAAAAIPVLLFDNLKGKKVADFCAAPGGKTAGLITKGAIVDAFDISEKRMKRVKENLDRLHYKANLIVQDANKIDGKEIYDAILIDAPCSATGTIRRHPDLYFHRTADDIKKLNQAQLKLLKTAHRLLKKKGQVVYCTCSLQKEEGESVIEQVRDLFKVCPVQNPKLKPYIQENGFIRTFPFQNKDGFFMALLEKI
ncbi:MAG: MFS transporter [Alphaproteobacteria bacterium]|nr:MFS transporter [Alphaproteobacteria bacterium]